MGMPTKNDRQGFAVEASLFELKPVVLSLFAACMVALVSVVGWLGVDGGSQLAASKPVRNNAANHGLIESSLPLNSATNQDSRRASADDMPANEASLSASDSAPPAVEAAETSAPHPALNTDGNAPASQAAPETLVNGGGYAVQAGSYNSISAANACVSRLRAAGFEARVAPVEPAKRGTWYRVHSGRFESREEATRHNKKLRASADISDGIVTALQP